MPDHTYRGMVMSGIGVEEYYGPPRPGQSWSQYESFMQMPIAASIGGVIIGAVLGGPIGAIAMGLGGWALGSGIQQKKKSLTQGG